MDDELRKVELEAAKLKLEREKLALARESADYERSQALRNAASETVKRTAETGNKLFRAIGVFILAMVVQPCLWSMSNSKNLVGEFGYKFGLYFVDHFFSTLIMSLWVAYLYFVDKGAKK